MRIERRFTTYAAGQTMAGNVNAVYEQIEFRQTTSEIKNPDGSIVFQAKDIMVPASWSQVAATFWHKSISAKRASLLPKKVEETSVPSWLWRSEADKKALNAVAEEQRFGGETDARQVFDRLAGTWTYWAWKGGYFEGEEDAAAISTKCATCWPIKWRRPTAHNGSTPACTGRSASMAQAKAITTLTTQPAS